MIEADAQNPLPALPLSARAGRRYAWAFVAFALLCAGLVLAVTLLIDPYGTSPLGLDIERVNAIRTERVSLDRLVKPADVLKLRPRTLIFGSSRIKEGFDPADFGGDYAPAYNFGVDFAGPVYAKAMLETLLPLVPEIKYVFIELYHTHFLSLNPAQPPGFADLAQDYATMFFSGQSLKATYRTIFKNRNYFDFTHWLHPTGAVELWPSDLPSDSRQFVAQSYWVTHIPDWRFGARQADYLRDTLALCARYGVECRFIMPPVHPIHLTFEQMMGHWADLEAIKRGVIGSAAVYDFTAYRGYGDEKIQLRDKHWLDVNHFTHSVGRSMADILVGRRQPEAGDPFGIVLTPQNIDSALAFWREERDAWMRNNPDWVAAIAARIKEKTGRAP